MDDTDRRLVSLLRDNARLPVASIAAILGISRATVQNRIDRLIRDGAIMGFTIKLRPDVEPAAINAIMMIEIEGERSEQILKALRGFELGDRQQLFVAGDFSSRIEDGRARNLIADAGAKYYWRWRENWLLYVGLSGTVTDALDPELQLLLGGDNGLRGFPLRYESGTSRALFTVEQRVFTDWYPFRLARVGAAVFADVGRTWGSGVVGNSDPGLLRDVGFGFRLGNTRSGLGNVLHIDFAFPLNNIAGIQKFQFLVQTMQSF